MEPLNKGKEGEEIGREIRRKREQVSVNESEGWARREKRCKEWKKQERE